MILGTSGATAFNARRWFIYALRDPLSWDVRYVGKANDVVQRYRRHIYDSPTGRYRNARWIASLRRRGLRPMLELLDVGSGDGHAAAERAWIAELRRQGADLTNTAAGGIGGSGPCTPEARKKISDAQRGKPRPPESIPKMAAAQRGKKQSAETKAKRAEALRGRPRSAETRAKISAAQREINNMAPEVRARIAETMRGKKLSDETRRKLSVSQAARRAREAAEHAAMKGQDS